MLRRSFVLLPLLSLVVALLPSPAVAQDELGPPSGTDPVVVERELDTTQPALVGVDTGQHEDYDRVVFEWDGPLPGYTVEYVDEIRRLGSGELVELEGDAALEVTFQPATGHDAEGNPTFDTGTRTPNLPALRQVESTGDFEAVVSFGLGLAEQVGFRVLELSEPNRIVVDVAHPVEVPGAIPVDEACTDVPDRGFTDVPEGHTFAGLIDCLAAYEITLGTGTGDTFEPQRPVHRWEMALFLRRYLELVVPDVVPDDPEPQGFDDIDAVGADAREAINAIASLDVTLGRTADTFAPFGLVGRDQMASFVNRALGVVATQPTTEQDFFTDDEGNTHEDNINSLASIGVVQGVGGRQYAPDRSVTRGQMSAFLLRSLEYNIEQGDFTGAAPWTDAVALDASCLLEHTGPEDLPSVELQYPSGWDRGDESLGTCRYFDPEPVEIPDAAEAFDVDVRWDIEPVAFSEAAQPDEATDEVERLPTTVDGHQAVRITATSTGEALLPEGIATTTWLVDLDIGTDDPGGTLVGTTADVDGVDYEQAGDVLDRMARSADIAPDENGSASQFTIARVEGGGSPYAVTYDSADGCFALFAGTDQGPLLDEVCDAGEAVPISATILRSDAHELGVGLTSGEVDVVRLRANTDAERAVATVPVGDDSRAYAIELSGTEATLVAETFDGEELGSVAVLPE